MQEQLNSRKKSHHRRSVNRKIKSIKLEHTNSFSKSDRQAEIGINKQVVICLDDDSDEQDVQKISKKVKTVAEVDYEREPLREELQYRVERYLCKLPQNGQLKVIRLNHFFKWKDTIYFEVMIGLSGELVYRQPQLVAMEQLCTSNEQTKKMVYHYIATICKSVSVEQKQLNKQNNAKE